MARDVTDMTPIGSRDELVRWFEQGQKPRDAFRVGTEHEKVPFYRDGHGRFPIALSSPILAASPICSSGLRTRTGWDPIVENGNTIGLLDPVKGGAISLEPGGQFELSGAPLVTLHETAEELATHLQAVKAVADPLGIGFLTLGMSPKWTLAETPSCPRAVTGSWPITCPRSVPAGST